MDCLNRSDNGAGIINLELGRIHDRKHQILLKLTGTDTSYEVVKAKNVFEGFVPIVKKSSGMGFGLLNR